MQTVLTIFLFLSWPFSDMEKATPEIVEIHHQIKSYSSSNLDSAAILVDLALVKSEELEDAFGHAQSQFIAGYITNRQGNTNQAVIHYLDALKGFMPIESTKALSFQANICLSIGKIYRQHYRINEAIDFYDKGMEYALEALDQKAFVKLLHNKAVAYRKVGKLNKAKDLLYQKLEIIIDSDKSEELYTYNQLGLVYRDLKSFEMALSYYHKIIDLDTGTQASLHRGQAYHNMAITHQQQEDYTKAWSFFNKALTELEPLNKAKDLFITYQDMASLALLQDRRSLAFSFANKATALLSKVPKTPMYYDQYHLLSNCIGESNPRQALVYSNQYFTESQIFNALQEELIAQGEGYKMDLITTNYFNEQREKEQESRFYLALFIGLILLLLSTFVSTRLWKIYRYKSPEVALSMIKNPKEMIYLLDLFRNEKEELKRMRKQDEKN